ncbi:MAG TPA: universal stress protein [Treponema sp.]|jgi:nucleotide-binding universal stress UspA family protein|nr:universal stress protein [Treponema sp.]
MIKPIFQKVLVAYNGSKSSLHAVMYAILMAKAYKCRVKVVYVVDTDTIKKLTLTKFLMKEEGYSFEGDLQQDGDKDLVFVTKLAKSKGVKIDAELRKGAVWSEIIAAADDYKADLILLGGAEDTSVSSLISHGLIGAQDSEIIGSAHCSVMVVRQPYIEQLFKIS